MTSTSFNIGIGEGRNSSRVLKPPGGGHTDIFGVHEEAPINKTTAVPPVNNIIITDKSANEIEKEQDENKEDKPVDEPKQESPSAQRVRVPPGGFSSGLW